MVALKKWLRGVTFALLLPLAMLWVLLMLFCILREISHIRRQNPSDLIWLAIVLANIGIPVRTAIQLSGPDSRSDRFWVLCMLAEVVAFFYAYRLPGFSF